MPQNSINKTIFWLFWTISHTRMGLMIWLGPYFQPKTGPYIPSTCRLFVYLFRSIGGCPNAPKQHKNTIFCLFWTISPTRMGLLLWLGGHFQAKILGRTSCPLAGLCVPFCVHLGVPKCPNTALKKLFSCCFGPFLLPEWAY
jgi:hypothetical protein